MPGVLEPRPSGCRSNAARIPVRALTARPPRTASRIGMLRRTRGEAACRFVTRTNCGNPRFGVREEARVGARWPAPRATHALPSQAGSASPVSLPPSPQIQRAPPSPGAEGRSQSQGGSVAWTETVLVLETASSLRSAWTREGRAGREAGLIRSWRGAVAAQEVWRVCGLPPRRPPAPGSPGLLGDGVTRGPKPEAEAAGAGVEGP